MSKARILCLSGIDTDIGKTIATGLIARGILEAGKTVITVKAVQTGCTAICEDIIEHRRLMDCGPYPEDEQGLTCPWLFSTPCSPHLAAALENVTIEWEKIRRSVRELSSRYDVVLLEGAGGLFVPLREDLLMIDCLAAERWPVILVTSCRLGSINHSLASFEALRHRDLELAGVVYNRHGRCDSRIAEDSLAMISQYIRRYGYDCPLIEMYDEECYGRQGDCFHFAQLADSADLHQHHTVNTTGKTQNL